MKNEEKQLEEVVNRMKDYIIENAGDHIIALYLAGRILTEDRAPTSDIEIFGIVDDGFDLKVEERINEFFEKHPEFCENRGKVSCIFYK